MPEQAPERPNRVEDLTIEQLRDEVWFWRIDAAATIAELTVRLAVRDADKKSSPRRPITERLRAGFETLSEALNGDYHFRCEPCGQPIRPGDATVSDEDCGEIHAECIAENHRRGDPPIRPGDKVYCDPAAIVVEDGEDKPDHLIAGEASRLYTHEQIVERLERARAALGEGSK